MRLLLLLLLPACSTLPLDGSALKAMTESEELCRCEVAVTCN